MKEKFTDSDAFVFYNALRNGLGDTQTMRHFLASMKQWDKTLISQASKKGEEKE